ncbi:hypothetical protein E1B28_013163 [Marasmius oreades]|uniref:Uncharacterized protein n=1 Tax=Marasmius oreades TaxID=181124 RepID=A0A9P7UPL5_9AGAR|nr:uncharacterized protein E1B28_013163 [Marasmius oreades]KAG7087184.1 hypothetical protein E1B28_013163 [Marasmius oreades]
MKFYRSPSLLTATEGGQPSFHVVALGLPGFAFSEGTKNTGKGFVLNHYAEVGGKLMLALTRSVPLSRYRFSSSP